MKGNTTKKFTIIALVLAFVVFFAVFRNNIYETFRSMDEQIGSSTLTSKDQKMYVITLRYMFENGTLAQSRDVYSFVDTEDENPSFVFDYDKTNPSADGYIPTIDGYTPNYTIISDTIDDTYIDRMKSANNTVVVEPEEDDYKIYKVYYTISYSPAASWYNVEYYQENVDKTGYVLYQQEQVSDDIHIGDAVVANIKDYEGFSYNDELSSISANVEKDGKTTLKVYYNRNTYNVYFDSNGGTYFDPFQKAYGDTMNYSDYIPTRDGYTFNGWECYNRETGEAVTNPSTMPAHDVYFRAKWTPAKTSFTITYFVENPDDDNYTNVGTYVVENVNTDSTISNLSNLNTYLTNGLASLKGSSETQYYSYNSTMSSPNLNVKVNGDGSTNVIVYYDRNEYTLTFLVGYKTVGSGWFSSTRYYYYTSYSNTGNTTSSFSVTLPDGQTYEPQTQNSTTGPFYTITAKYEQDISAQWPTISKISTDPETINRYAPYGWSYMPNNSSTAVTQVSGMFNLTNSMINTDGTGKTLRLVWTRNSNDYTAHYMLETIDGTGTAYNGTYYEEKVEYQTKAQSSNFSHKEIKNFYYNDNDKTTSGNDIYLYYHRNRYELQYYNVIEIDTPDLTNVTIPNGVTVENGKIEVAYGADISQLGNAVFTDDQYPLTTSGSKNWTFAGWYQDENCTIPMDWNRTMTDNLVVYAKWTPPTYEVKIDTKGGELVQPEGYTHQSTDVYVHIADEGETLTTPGIPTKSGYLFEGWYYIDSNGNEVEYLFSDSQNVYSDLSIYAKWKPDVTGYYNVYYVEAQYDDDGNIITDVSQYTNPKFLAEATVAGPVAYGSTVTATAKYIPPAEGRIYIVDDMEKSTTVNYGEDNEIYFIYTPVEHMYYTVYYLKQTYDTNGNPIYYEDGEIPPESEYLASKDIVTVDYLESNTVTHESKLIDGYEVDAYNKTIILTTKSKNMTPEQNAMYFYYEPVENTGEYKVNYYFMDENGDYPQTPTRSVEGEASVGTFITVEDYDTYLPVSQNQELYRGHELDYDSSNILMVVVSSYGVSEIDIYFKNSNCTVSYDTKGGTWTDESEIYTPKTANVYDTDVVYGNTAPVPTNPTKNGYRFKGWYKDSLCTIPYDFNDPVEEDITLYAGWVELKSLTINKIWEDNNNQDGIRPDTASISIKADGVVVRTITLDKDHNFTAQVDNLDVTNDNGQTIIYTIEENYIAAGYTASYSRNGDTLTVTNTHVPETKIVNIQKVWLDNSNQDGIRPSSVVVNLKQNNAIYQSNITLDSSNTWKQQVEVPVYKAGVEATYSVEEIAVAGYTTSYSNGKNDIVITNTHIPETKTLTIEKVWADDNNRDGLRPSSVSVEVKAGDSTYTNVNLTAQDNWTTTLSGVPVYSNGTAIVYSVEEASTTGYTSSVESVNNKYIVTNTHIPEKVALNVTKVWNDGNNQDGIRPSSIEVAIKQNGTYHSTMTISSEDNWTKELGDLYKYSNGELINYTIDEEHTNGYVTTTEKNGYNYTITNTHTPEVTNITVDKTWSDSNDSDGLRTSSVTANLYANGNFVASGELSGTNNWTYTFSNVPKNSAGQAITYTADETAIEGYDTTVEYDSISDVWHITNTHVPVFKTFVVSKIWDDDNNRDGKRPESVTINLSVNGSISQTKYITAANNWADVSFDNLPAYLNGSLVNYEITEEVVDDYSTSVSQDGDHFTFTNTHTPELIDKTVTKQWRDGSNQEGFRPDSITFAFYKNGVKYGDDVTLTAANAKADNSNEWIYTYNDLYKYENGQEVSYTVEELGLVDGKLVVNEALRQIYSAIYNQQTLHIYNAYPPEVNISAHKNWEDEDNADGLRPENLPIQLKYKSENESIYQDYVVDGQNVGYQLLNEDNNWTYDYGFLQKYNDLGELLEYVVEEAEIPANYELVGIEENEEETQYKKVFEITNRLTHEVEKTTRTVTKTWTDGNNQDGRRPASVTVRLLANGVEVRNATLSDSNGWTTTFENLNVNQLGNPIAYTVTEDAVSDYSTNITYNSNELTFNIENTYVPETKTITVNKTWTDGSNQDGIRPSSVSAQILADGSLYQEVELNSTNSWTTTLDNVPVYSNGTRINYTVEETVPQGYTSIITQVGDTFNIVNTHIPEKRNIKVSKVWADDSNRDGLRPTNIVFNFLADGDVIRSGIILNNSNSWEYTINNLDKYKNGNEISYTIEELSIQGYTSSISYSDLVNDNIVITNTHIPEIKTITINKVWEDNNDLYNLRPNSITIKVLANNQEVAQTELYESSNWQTNVGGLYINSNGQPITYTVEEVNQDKYTTSQSTQGNTITLTNTIITYNIDTEVIGVGGTISGQNQDVYETVAKGESNTKPIVITPNTGYLIKSIKINDIEQELPQDLSSPYTLPTIENITQDTTVKVEFEKQSYKVTTVVDGGNGTISGEGEDPYEFVKYGESNTKEIKITPNSGYEIESITINGVEQELPDDPTQEYILPTIEDITENKEVIVKFTKIPAIVTVKHVTVDGEILETETIEGFIGDTYETQPIEREYYELVETPQNAQGTMEEKETIVEYVYEFRPPLTITKMVRGNYSDKDKVFNFTINLIDKDGIQIDRLISYTIYNENNAVVTTGNTSNGTATFNLKHGQNIVFSDIPSGTAYTISETNDTTYTTYINNRLSSTKTITDVLRSDTTIDYINEKNYNAPTGITLSVLPFTIGFGIILLLVIVVVKINKKRKIR